MGKSIAELLIEDNNKKPIIGRTLLKKFLKTLRKEYDISPRGSLQSSLNNKVALYELNSCITVAEHIAKFFHKEGYYCQKIMAYPFGIVDIVNSRGDKDQWGFHVAVLIKVIKFKPLKKDFLQLMVIDPILDINKPIHLSKWVSILSEQDRKIKNKNENILYTQVVPSFFLQPTDKAILNHLTTNQFDVNKLRNEALLSLFELTSKNFNIRDNI